MVVVLDVVDKAALDEELEELVVCGFLQLLRKEAPLCSQTVSFITDWRRVMLGRSGASPAVS